jgi:serine-type D-Ala-D-Ala carboxypeptidase (penicillin-binding protein 5/6)
MNARADELGASDTHVVTPSGLTARGAHSSARDLVLFLRAAHQDAVVAPLLDRATYRFGPRVGTRRTIHRTTDYVNRYVATNPGTRGKSGFTTPAKNTLVVNTLVRGRNIAVATLGAPGGWSTKGARTLTMWANANLGRLDAVGLLPSGG